MCQQVKKVDGEQKCISLNHNPTIKKRKWYSRKKINLIPGDESHDYQPVI